MKNFYSFILAGAAMLAPVASSAAVVTLYVDDPASVRVVRSEYDPSIGQSTEVNVVDPVEEGANIVNYNPGDYWSIEVKPNDGYKLSSVTENGVDVLYGQPIKYIYLDSSQDGKVYMITTKNLAQARTATATVTVDDASKVNMERNGGSQVTLQNGTNTVKFIPGEESPFRIMSRTSTPLCSVTLGGVEQTPQYGSYSVNVEDGAEINIRADFPDESYVVKLTVPEGCEDFVSSVVDGNYQTLSGNILEGISMKAGSRFGINFNTTKYKLDRFLVNGEEAYVSSSYNGTVTTSDINMTAEIHPYGTFDVVFDVDDPSRVEIFEGYNAYGTKYEISAGANTLSFVESSYGDPQVYMQPTAGNLIESVTRYPESGDPEVITYFPFSVKKGERYVIVTAEKVREDYITLWIDPAAEGKYTAIRFQNYTEPVAVGPFTTGLNTVKFSQADLPFSMYVDVKHPDEIPDGYQPWQPVVMLDDLVLDGTTSFYFEELTSGSFMRIFAETPVMHLMSVFLGDATDSSHFAIDADGQAVEGWQTAGFAAYKGSTVSIAWTNPEPDSDEYVYSHVCTLDGTDLVADADGKCSFVVTGDHSLTLKEDKVVAIDGVGADQAVSAPVYNLQGIQVASDEAGMNRLPAGVYVINGKKIRK